MEQDPYKILQVIPTAEQEVIDAAYRGLARRYHPDVNPGPEAAERMKEINSAYRILKDPEARARYDRSHSVHEGEADAQRTSGVRKSTPGGSSASRYTAPQTSQHDQKAADQGSNQAAPGNLSYCQRCGALAPTSQVSFHRVIGVIVVRFRRHTTGQLCARCNEEVFWSYTGTTLLFGWWALNSFILAPFILIGNFIEYQKTSSIRKNVNLGDVSRNWKLAAFFMLIFGLVFGLLRLSNSFSNAVANSSPASESSQVNYAATTDAARNSGDLGWENDQNSITNPTATRSPTAEPCLTWAEITLDDVGKTRCVYGVVLTAYTNDNIFYMTFSRKASDFYMVSYGGWYEGVQGNCVLGKGEIKQIGQAPIMIIDEKNLFECR